MADDPSVSDPGRRPSTSRADDAAHRRAAAWRRVAAIGAVVVLAVIAGLLLLGGDDGVIPGIGGDGGPDAYRFELRGVRASSTGEGEPADVQGAAEEIKGTLEQLYFHAYVDRDSWGAYEEAFALFDGPAGTSAERDVEVLTLGAGADAEYERLRPTLGTLSVVVLTNGGDRPVSAIASVDFRADAERTDGTSTSVTSEGAYFLRPAGDGWRIYAYRITRDEEAAAGASPTGSPS